MEALSRGKRQESMSKWTLQESSQACLIPKSSANWVIDQWKQLEAQKARSAVNLKSIISNKAPSRHHLRSHRFHWSQMMWLRASTSYIRQLSWVVKATSPTSQDIRRAGTTTTTISPSISSSPWHGTHRSRRKSASRKASNEGPSPDVLAPNSTWPKEGYQIRSKWFWTRVKWTSTRERYRYKTTTKTCSRKWPTASSRYDIAISSRRQRSKGTTTSLLKERISGILLRSDRAQQ